MAERAIVKAEPNLESIIVSWSGLLNTDTGAPWTDSHAYADKSVEVSGTFSVGGEVTVEGLINDSSYSTLHDLNGAPLVITSAGVHYVAENPKDVRPRVSGGDGSTDLAVAILGRTEG